MGPRLFIGDLRPGCLRCGGSTSAAGGGLLGRIFRLGGRRCDACGALWYQYRPMFTFLQSNASCPRCLSYDISRLRHRDKIDPMSRNPLRRLLFFAGAPIYYCTFCRFQFRDWRPLHPFLTARDKRNAPPEILTRGCD